MTASPAIRRHDVSIADKGDTIFARLVAVASGERTTSERLGDDEFVPWQMGAVL